MHLLTYRLVEGEVFQLTDDAIYLIGTIYVLVIFKNSNVNFLFVCCDPVESG